MIARLAVYLAIAIGAVGMIAGAMRLDQPARHSDCWHVRPQGAVLCK